VIGPIPYLSLQTKFDATAPKGIHAYWKAEYLNNLIDDAINVLVEHYPKMKSLSPFAAVHIHHWRGAIERAYKDVTA
jgi:hypothetical protein